MFNSTEINFLDVKLSWTDYILFGTLLSMSVLIGGWFGLVRKQTTTTEYNFGGKTMNYFPVHLSGIALVGVPAEIYQYGTHYLATIVSVILTGLVTVYICLPVFYHLQQPSVFGYLQLRFSRSTRLIYSFFYIITLFIYVPIVIYVPALGLAQVTKISIHVIAPGGLKAVVWTDTLQFTIVVVSIVAIFAIGVKTVGGFAEIFRVTDQGGRLIFLDLNPSPFVRNSFFATTLGMTLHFFAVMSVNQGAIQKLLSVPTEKNAAIATLIMSIMEIFMKILFVFIGLIIYTRYRNCDPVSTKIVDRSDQIFPFFVMEVTGHIPGLAGLFLTGLGSAALSTMSTNLNVISGIVYEDFIEPWIPDNAAKDANGTKIMKLLVVIAGFISIGLVFVVDGLGTVFQISISLRSVIDGPMVGIFFLGLMVPWVKTRGALIGTFVSFVFMLWYVGSSEYYKLKFKTFSDTLPISVEQCPYPLNNTVIHSSPSQNEIEENSIPLIYQISFLYYTAIGFIVMCVVAISASFILKETDIDNVNPEHFTPFVKRNEWRI
ncbi:Similar to Slc5a12: Sodium-coupled monocarboxylate transporter 2 (Mus musculus) [Cotesia congregata]|uniref:Similar to Slc5a12: Sodium-coupled monocarboxylate transporter 2 (Mus musculus) n=1 Tax=Cotesia congregata TaxID=51543 RepID=A0A8J2MN69_COTCN|nr:Similar to Slc5a12: Sodium-coupled monocarboxylate transporter 2 (Mus musculus) [Cotesia congregata]